MSLLCRKCLWILFGIIALFLIVWSKLALALWMADLSSDLKGSVLGFQQCTHFYSDLCLLIRMCDLERRNMLQSVCSHHFRKQNGAYSILQDHTHFCSDLWLLLIVCGFEGRNKLQSMCSTHSWRDDTPRSEQIPCLLITQLFAS